MKIHTTSTANMGKHTFLTVVLGLAFVLLAPLSAQAATASDTYKNGTDITTLFLWSDDPSNMTFISADLSDKKLAGWTVAANTGSLLILEGPEIKKSAGKFVIDYNYVTSPFTVQFAEVMFNTTTLVAAVQDRGNMAFDGKKFDKAVAQNLSNAQLMNIAAHFPAGSTIVPVPNSVVLMAGCLGFLGFAHRRNATA